MNYDQLREINMPIISALRDLGTALAEQNVTGEVTVTLPYPWTVSPYGEMTVYTDCGQVIVKKRDVEDDARKYENRIRVLSEALGVYRAEVIARDLKIQSLMGLLREVPNTPEMHNHPAGFLGEECPVDCWEIRRRYELGWDPVQGEGAKPPEDKT
jgi:hypothetical protein